MLPCQRQPSHHHLSPEARADADYSRAVRVTVWLLDGRQVAEYLHIRCPAYSKTTARRTGGALWGCRAAWLEPEGTAVMEVSAHDVLLVGGEALVCGRPLPWPKSICASAWR